MTSLFYAQIRAFSLNGSFKTKCSTCLAYGAAVEFTVTATLDSSSEEYRNDITVRSQLSSGSHQAVLRIFPSKVSKFQNAWEGGRANYTLIHQGIVIRLHKFGFNGTLMDKSLDSGNYDFSFSFSDNNVPDSRTLSITLPDAKGTYLG